MDGAWERALNFFKKKSGAYKRVFGKNEGDAHTILLDLAIFCRAHQSTYHPDPRTHALLEGRREVWLRIQDYLHLTPQQLAELKIQVTKREDMTNA